MFNIGFRCIQILPPFENSVSILSVDCFVKWIQYFQTEGVRMIFTISHQTLGCCIEGLRQEEQACKDDVNLACTREILRRSLLAMLCLLLPKASASLIG